MRLLPAKARRAKKKPVTWSEKKGRCKGGGRSSKAKGRAGVEAVRALLLKYLPLEPGDVFVKATSQGGCDMHFSPKALQYFPYDPEVKFVENLAIWKALEQAQNNATISQTPILFFKRSRTPLFIALRAEDFLKVVTRGLSTRAHRD